MTSDERGASHGEPGSEALDLTALQVLRLDSARHAALAARIEAAAAPVLAARATRASGIWEILAGAARPVLITAAAALILAIGLGRRGDSAAAVDSDVVTAGVLALTSTESALPSGAADATWIAQQSTPTDADLARAIGLEAEAGENP